MIVRKTQNNKSRSYQTAENLRLAVHGQRKSDKQRKYLQLRYTTMWVSEPMPCKLYVKQCWPKQWKHLPFTASKPGSLSLIFRTPQMMDTVARICNLSIRTVRWEVLFQPTWSRPSARTREPLNTGREDSSPFTGTRMLLHTGGHTLAHTNSKGSLKSLRVYMVLEMERLLCLRCVLQAVRSLVSSAQVLSEA